MSLYNKTLMCTGSVLFLAGFLAGCSTPESGVVARASHPENQKFVDSADRCRGGLISLEVQRKLRLGYSEKEVSAWLRSSCPDYTVNLDDTEFVSRSSGNPSESVSDDAPDNNAANDGKATSSGGGAGLSEASESNSGAGGNGPSGNSGSGSEDGSGGSEGGSSGGGSVGQGSDSSDGGSNGGAGGHGNGGNGGGHANNGGGNGSEGSSPGQGHGANNDEGG